MTHTNEMVLTKIQQLYESLFLHNGFGEMSIEMRILKRGQKEVIIHCGKQYRYVVDYPASKNISGNLAEVACAKQVATGEEE